MQSSGDDGQCDRHAIADQLQQITAQNNGHHVMSNIGHDLFHPTHPAVTSLHKHQHHISDHSRLSICCRAGTKPAQEP